MGNLAAAAGVKRKEMDEAGTGENIHLHFHLDKSMGEILKKMRVSMNVNEIFVKCTDFLFKFNFSISWAINCKEDFPRRRFSLQKIFVAEDFCDSNKNFVN